MKSAVVPVERRLLAVAARQHGVVSSAQLAAAGMTRHQVAGRVAAGWLRRVHRGVYLVGPLASPHTAAMAAVLALGRGAVASHLPAAALWGLRPAVEGPMHVIVPRGSHGRPGITVHRTVLDPADVTHRDGVPVTSPPRTLLDIAAARPRELERALNEARVLRLATDLSLNEQLRRYPRHRGAAALRDAIGAEPHMTRSEAERRMLALIREVGLPAPETNVRIAGYEVDFLWRDHKLVVEVDGYAFHSSRRSFERDRRKEVDLVAAGLRVARVTWRQLDGEAVRVAVRLATALAA